MSFDTNKSGTVEAVLKSFKDDENVPDEVYAFVEKAVKPFDASKVMIFVRAFGNLYDGSNYEISSLNVTVQKTNEIHPSLLNKDEPVVVEPTTPTTSVE